MTTTTVAIRDLPVGLKTALRFLNPKGRDIKIEARATACPATYTNLAEYNANALVPSLDESLSVQTRTGVWGGNNGYNRAPEDTAWDPVFDTEQREVPLGGAIVVGHKGKHCFVYVHPTTFAERFLACPATRDAFLDGRTDALDAIQSEASALTDEECAILYAHWGFKSGDGRKAIVSKFSDALESCVSRTLIKRSSNGACAITTAGKALSDTWRKRGENLAYKVRW